MKSRKLKKVLILNIPYTVIGLYAVGNNTADFNDFVVTII